MRRSSRLCSLVGLCLSFWLVVFIVSSVRDDQSTVRTAPPSWLIVNEENKTVQEDFPRIIHHIMFKWGNVGHIPRDWRHAVSRCRALHSGYTHRLWTDGAFMDFLKEEYPWFVQPFVAYKYDVQRVDAAKYFIMYHFGGVYLDMDIACRRPLDPLLFGRVNPNVNFTAILAPADPVGYVTDFMVSKPRQPFFQHVISRLLARSQSDFILPYLTVFMTTGPLFLTNSVRTYPLSGQLMVIPEKDYLHHYFLHIQGSSWHQWDGKIIWILFVNKKQFLVLFLFVAGFIWFTKQCTRYQSAFKKVTMMLA